MVVLWVVHFNHVHKALEEPSRFIGTVRAIHPRIIADCHSWRQLEFLDFCQHGRVPHAECLNLSHLVYINRSLYSEAISWILDRERGMIYSLAHVRGAP
jgi:hypothetical protein